MPTDDGPVVLVTFEGRLRASELRGPPGSPETAAGRFAYLALDPATATPLNFGLLPSPPGALTPRARG